MIDLRHNGGGYDVGGTSLFAYLIDKPTPHYRRQHTIMGSSKYLQFADLSAQELAEARKTMREEPDGTFTLTEVTDQTVAPQPVDFTNAELAQALKMMD